MTMRIFVTGATGFIGSAVVRELLDAGHQVLGLARTDRAGETLAWLGAAVHKGELSDLESLAAGALACEGVIHLGFVHDSGDFPAAAETDREAIAAMGGALANSDKIFIGTSGTMLLAPGRLGTEDDAGDPQSAAAFRVPSEEAVLSMVTRGVRAMVVRPAPTVHGAGEHGFIPMLIKIARDKGVSAYVGDGLNRWPAVHRLDAAHLFKLALEEGAAGARYHAVGEEGIPFRDIAEVIGRQLNVQVVAKSPEEAADHFGPLSFVVSVDNPASSARTRERLGWRPSQPGLIPDLDHARYFEV
jgi:nucleoside-diphosphate-sugar epimerase